MDHVPLPQRPPRRKQRARRDASSPRAAAAAAAGTGALSMSNASVHEQRPPARGMKRSSPSELDRDVADDDEGRLVDGMEHDDDDDDDDADDAMEGEVGCPEFMPESEGKVVDGLRMASQYEYKDHTADIQIHSWGDSVEECFAWAAIGMFNYMTPLEHLASSAAEAEAVGQAAGTGRVPGNANMRKDENGDGAAEGATAGGAPCDDNDDDAEDGAVTDGGEFVVSRRRGTGAGAGAEASTSSRLTHGHVFEVEAHDMQSLLFAFLDELLFNFHTSMLVCRQIQVGTIDRVNWRVKGVGRGEKFVDGVHEQGTEIKAITYSAMQIAERGGGKGTEVLPCDGRGGGSAAELFVIVDI